MKVALVVPGGVDRSGTVRVIPSLLWLIERLARVHELHVFALSQEPRPARWRLLGAEVHNAGYRFRQGRALAQLVAEHRRAPFDVLHGAWAVSGAVTAVARRLLRRPMLLHMPGGDLTALPGIGYGRQLTRRGRFEVRLAVAAAARVTVPSDYMLRQAERLGIRAEKLAYGVSVQDWP
ncbi:MAG TPA: glycosyltransferase, partial [Longimicrobiaceae bacterium]|nr:glycosyltransferase [Longimicrobiaceae bacterium]